MKSWACYLLALSLVSLGLKTTANADCAVQVVDSLELGQLNAVKKAHQMTDLEFVPVNTFQSYSKSKSIYHKGKKYTGVNYSSVKETNTFVGQDVSIFTYMTALHNPRSVIYTEHTNEPPYHGSNCRAYYGTVCSGLINYALGIKITKRSADILVDSCFERIENQSLSGIRVADMLCKNGHPRMITGIEKDQKGQIIRVEISVAANTGCKRYFVEGENAFNKMLKDNNYIIYRYKDLYKNTSYSPANEFVAVGNEEKIPFTYNDDICANKGDKSCYVLGESVILNVLGKGKEVEVYKDSKLYKKIKLSPQQLDLVLKDYPYGDYQACLVSGNNRSAFTKWKIIDAIVTIDKVNKRICFSSKNATPVYYEFCNIGGGRPSNKNRIYAAEFTSEDLKRGYVKVDPPYKPSKSKAGYPYVKVHFECDYGMVVNKPVEWF